MKLKFYTTHLIIILPILVIVIIGLLIFLPSSVRAADEVVKAEMYMGDYEIRREKTPTGSFINKEVKYIETGSGKIIKERTSVTNSWKISYYHTNHQGSTSVVSNNQGRVDTEYSRGRLRYFPYGEQITSHNINTQAVADTYTGQKRDTESNLMFYNARLYNQNTGLFMQADSVNDGLNRYMYVGGSPTNAIDPTGHFILNIGLAAAGFIGGAIVGGAIDALVQYKTTGEVDLGRVAISAVSSGVTAGCVAGTVGLGAGICGGIGAGAQMVATTVYNSAHGMDFPEAVANAAVETTISTAVGYGAGKAIGIVARPVVARLPSAVNQVVTSIAGSPDDRGVWGQVYIAGRKAFKIFDNEFGEARWQYDYLREYAPQSGGLLPTPVDLIINTDTGAMVGYTMNTAPGKSLLRTGDIVPDDVAADALTRFVNLQRGGFMHKDIHPGNVMYDPITRTVTLIDPMQNRTFETPGPWELERFYETMTKKFRPGRTPRIGGPTPPIRE